MKWVKNFVRYIAIISVLIFTSQLHADDIDIFETEKPQEPPNILFIMDVSGSMEWDIDGYLPTDPANSRLTILRNAMATFLNDPEMVDINVGISRYAGDTSISSFDQTAHGITFPVSPIDADADTILNSNPEFTHPGPSYLPTADGITTRGYLQKVADDWIAYGGTPLVDSLFEAALYFRGQETNWGRQDPSKIRSAHPSTYTGLISEITNTTTGYKCINESCSGASCNSTKTCTTSTQTNYCDTASCGTSCTGPSTIRQTCGGSETSCGTGTNCVEQSETLTRNCSGGIELICRIFNPTYYDCKLVEEERCGPTTCPDGQYDEFGACINPDQDCPIVKWQQCKEDITRTVCDAEQYECTTDIESCEHEVCGNITTTTTELIGAGKFISPIKNECSNNAIVLLSDGIPSASNSADLISEMIGGEYSNNCATGTDDGRCGKELAKYLANEDVAPTIDGDQFVNTYTIGFAMENDPAATDYMKTLAELGGGSFAPASSVETLVKAFKDAVSGVNNKARVFSSPTYTTNPDSILTHGEYVYLPVFNRESSAHWSGNLKKFKIVNGRLVDKEDNNKFATTESGILQTAKDEWATGDIVHPIKDGGAANLLDPDARVLYTDNGSHGQAATIVPLNENNVSNAQLGASTDIERTQLIDFIKGKKSDGTPRYHMGDIIHSKPVHVKIDGTGFIFIGTNEGYLHAFKEDGTEAFAYMPSELLKNIKIQKGNLASEDHVYGVDSEITVWKGKVGSDSKTYLLFGLRRGGKAYYALDVTNPVSPTLAWKVTPATAGFSNLGYTWSKPKTGKVRISASETKDVMIVGGGYVDDSVLPELEIPTANFASAQSVVETDDSGTGADIFIIDIATGTKAWKASDVSNAISFAIPAGIRALDIDRNGLIDRLYAADTGGYIWRVDLDFSPNIAQAKLYPFADLGGAVEPKRKFFNEPDVAFFRHAGQYIISVAIGSGDRTNPLDESTDDRFFTLFDTHPFKYTATDTPNLAEMVIDDLNTDLVSVSDAKDHEFVKTTLNTKKGWYIDFDNYAGSSGVAGEKVLSSALIYENRVYFSSFGKGAVVVDPNDACKTTSANQSHFYGPPLIPNANSKLSIRIKKDGVYEDHPFIGPLPDIPAKPQLHIAPPTVCTKGKCVIDNMIIPGMATPIHTERVNRKLPRVYWLDKQ